MCDLLVVGGGASGMLAALFAAREGARVELLERNEKLGKKVYITGKGRCNLTNVAQGEQFMGNVVRNPRFLYAALSGFASSDTIALIESLGVPVKIERGGRAFPVSDKASDIIRALEKELVRLGVRIRLHTRVAALCMEEGRVTGVKLESGEKVRAKSVLIGTGGVSYPTTGSTGDGYKLARQAGHTIVTPLPALVPVETQEKWPFALSGLTLKNVSLSWEDARGKRKFDQQGEMLFTHFGISGPLVLSLSSYLDEKCAGAKLYIDLKPALTAEAVDKRLLRDLKEMSRKRLITVMDGLAPHALALTIAELAHLSPDMPANALTQEGRRALGGLLKRLPLTVKGLRGLDEAIITRGGVAVKEVNPSTMESKKTSGLYFAGEVLDIDALTGGYNLQLAFATGALAGRSAAAQAREGA